MLQFIHFAANTFLFRLHYEIYKDLYDILIFLFHEQKFVTVLSCAMKT